MWNFLINKNRFVILSFYMSPQVLSSKYDMEAYMATPFGGEAWDLCWSKARANSQPKTQDIFA